MKRGFFTLRRSARGYSLAELLVVVAIIGVISLVSVPAFLTMQRNGRLKTSMRQMATDIRAARQVAVAQHTNTRVAFTIGTSATSYTIYRLRGTSWVRVGQPKRLETGCYVANETNFRTTRDAAVCPACTNNDSDDYDLIFRSNGTAIFDTGVYTGTMVVTSEFDLPIRQYTIAINFAGVVKVS